MNPSNQSFITDHQPRRLRSRAAFTLVELLIATGITVAMVLMLGLM